MSARKQAAFLHNVSGAGQDAAPRPAPSAADAAVAERPRKFRPYAHDTAAQAKRREKAYQAWLELPPEERAGAV